MLPARVEHEAQIDRQGVGVDGLDRLPDLIVADLKIADAEDS
jgi:hypothetical protein